MKRTLIIGDVHGCLDELDGLLAECGHRKGERVVFTGDLVAKGPDSRGVIARAIELKAKAARGNHDQKALDRRELELGTREWRWLEKTPLWVGLPAHGAVVVHAGLVPGRALNRQRKEDLLNLRSITAGGEPSKKIEGVPWASRWPGPRLVVFGHDAVRGLQLYEHAIGLDTGCVYGGSLTALLLPSRERVSVKAKRAYVKPSH